MTRFKPATNFVAVNNIQYILLCVRMTFGLVAITKT
jgi:hypothetical protein